jgi:glycosyltransferase involved in cell wall biosynthesis
MNANAPVVSFIVPVKNDAVRLERCLRSLLANRSPAAGLELIVVDNGSTDDSIAVAERMGATVLRRPAVRLGALRNHGARAARGAVLAFVDADNEIAPGWVAAALDALNTPGVAAVGAPYRSPAAGTWVQRQYDRLRRHPPGRQEVEWLGSGNLAIHRPAFDAVVGFDSALDTCEDVDLCRKLRAAGARLVSDERLLNVHHGDPATLRHVFSGELWRGRDNLRVSLRPPRTWRTLISAIIPVAVLSALLLVPFGLISASRAGVSLAAAASLFVLLLVGARSLSMVSQPGSAREWPAAFAVAGAYELGRAFAIAARAGYGSRRGAAS